MSLLRVRGDGPTILRIGGNSADLTYWNHGPARSRAGAFVLTPGWFERTRRLVSRLRLHLILDLNLLARSPAVAVTEARAALARLPAGSIDGFEIGNEPDRFGNAYSAAEYVQDFRSFAREIRRVTPSVALMGPAITNTSTNFDWLRRALAGDHPQLAVLTGHRYALNACREPGSTTYPTIARVLAESSSVGVAQSVAAAVRLAHQAMRPFRLDEVNSVTCGGLRGVSDTFATALWAPDAMFALLRMGLDGLNVHIRPDRINSPFLLTPTGLVARPLLYGLILFVRALGHGGQLIPSHLSPARLAGLKAWAVRVPRKKVRVLLINKSAEPVTVHLPTQATTEATVERLLGPSARATSGVTLAGQHLSRTGNWLGHKMVERLRPNATGYSLTVAPLSAALVGFALAG